MVPMASPHLRVLELRQLPVHFSFDLATRTDAENLQLPLTHILPRSPPAQSIPCLSHRLPAVEAELGLGDTHIQLTGHLQQLNFHTLLGLESCVIRGWELPQGPAGRSLSDSYLGTKSSNE